MIPCFGNVLYKNRSKITDCSYDYQAKWKDYLRFFMFRIILNNYVV